MAKKLDLIGERFGRLVVEESAGIDSSGHTTWKCKCDCGNVKIARGSHLKRGYIQSCGCLAIDTLKENSTKHGLEHTRLYRIWHGMLIRCHNPKSNRYHRYGGRGITVCDEWRYNLQAFYDWALANGYRDNLTLDRKDNDGPYSPENCKWSTYKEQLNHTSVNHFVTIDGTTKTVTQWAEENGIKISTVYTRLSRGWSIERAITEQPIKPGKK